MAAAVIETIEGYPSMHQMFRLAVVVAVAVSAVSSLGCNHAVAIKMADQSQAQISVDGQPVGTAPATYQEGPAMKDSTYQIEAKRPDGSVVKTEGKRSESAGMDGAGIGAGIGAAACVGLSCVGGIVGGVASFVGLGFIGAPLGCLGCAALVAGPIAGYVMAGRSPDTVVVGGPAGPAGPAIAPPPMVPVPPPLPNDPAGPVGAAPPSQSQRF